ncbi:Fur-regulated basic protein FbpA [Sporosarcina sp. ACRSM]|uniref:Fur-regulated basic protein FbpA n=1 Tax=Sporosarcina sp. ACRSM TaxID=2918216 RepID=UPI001EF70D5C|nr:Fur-regulated basic protein FbpA [Sporosarcina sp. ACRSM]MCG7336835.1 Fur-regulated basic protein FbpA [Sporosarcina sp. ACRSM]
MFGTMEYGKNSSWIQQQGGSSFIMKKQEETPMEVKKEKIIQKLVNKGVYKLEGKQLYELPLYSLMKAYTIRME